MRNNLVINCPADVGIYLNQALDAQVHHNTLYNNTGIDVRFPASSVDLRNNLLNGQIRNRDGGQSAEGSNLEGVSLAQMQAWFADPANADFTLLDGSALVDLGESVAALNNDFCGNVRDDGLPDIGAVEYDGDGLCDTTTAGGSEILFRDGFES